MNLHGGAYSLYTRDSLGLLNAMMSALASDTTKISIEGTLSHTDWYGSPESHTMKSGYYDGRHLRPAKDFIILSLSEQTLPAIRKAINSKIAIGEKRIVHVQIVKDGDMAFAAYDGFDKECVVAYSRAVSSELLDELTKGKVLRGYRQITPPISRQ